MELGTGSPSTIGHGIAVDSSGNVFTAGEFSGTGDFSGLGNGSGNATAAGSVDGYVSEVPDLSDLTNIAFTATANRPFSGAVATFTDPGDPEIPSGLVGWYPGEGNANDVSGSNNGTLLGTTSFATAEIGTGFSFASNSDGVTVPDNPSLDVQPSGFSVDFWMRSNGAQPDTQSLIIDHSHGFGDGTGWAFQTISSGALQFFIGDGTGFRLSPRATAYSTAPFTTSREPGMARPSVCMRMGYSKAQRR